MQLVIPERNRSFGALDAIAVIGVIGFSIARFIPVAKLIPFWGCGFRKMTGIPCPGCGLTRVADRMAHFNPLGALKANPLGTLAATGFAIAIVWSFAHLVFAAPVPELVLQDKEWRRVRWGAFLLFSLNYAWVIFAYAVLGLR